jgi:hypothetical protein
MRLAHFFLCLISVPLLSGCCSIYVDRDFVAQSDGALVTGLKSDVRVAPRTTTIGTPVLLEYQQRSAPYDLRIRIDDESHSFREIEVTQITVTFSDGITVSKDVLWQRNLHLATSTRDIATDTAFDEQIEDVIERHADATITLKGRLLASNGEFVEFNTSTMLKAKTRFSIVPLLLHGA